QRQVERRDGLADERLRVDRRRRVAERRGLREQRRVRRCAGPTGDRVAEGGLDLGLQRRHRLVDLGLRDLRRLGPAAARRRVGVNVCAAWTGTSRRIAGTIPAAASTSVASGSAATVSWTEIGSRRGVTAIVAAGRNR